MSVPSLRIRLLNDHPVRPDGDYVLYWMIASRRTTFNFALERAVEHARTMGRPLLVFEPLRFDHPYASLRLHQFAMEGMRDNALALARHALTYPYVEPAPGAAHGLLHALAGNACIVVTDDFPCYFLPHLVARAAAKVQVAMEAVDGNGLVPCRAAPRAFPTAAGFRTFWQRAYASLTAPFPTARPLDGLAPPPTHLGSLDAVERRWPPWRPSEMPTPPGLQPLGGPPPVPMRGGSVAAHTCVDTFIRTHLPEYEVNRDSPDADACSNLAAYLHWGHVSAHEVLASVLAASGGHASLHWKGVGARRGFWGCGGSAEAFLDQLVTWREVGFNMCSLEPRYDQAASLPEWARTTLELHRADPRPYRYDRDAFEEARTHDPLWNAAQRQLLEEGRIHNALRMLWGKKILEWSESPEEALRTMIALNNTYALDGRDPNSYSGIFWCLGRYDRPWGPVRPIFGTVRYMSSTNTARKRAVKRYLARYGAPPPS